MRIIGIDPGPEESGWVEYEGETNEVRHAGVLPNHDLRVMLSDSSHLWGYDAVCAIEMIASYGMAVGAEVFETCVWVGRYQEVWYDPHAVRKVYRTEVKQYICHNASAKDANVRQAIIDRFPRTGAGAVPQIGTKKKPGPLFGVTSHAWPALGVALTAHHKIMLARAKRVRLLRKYEE